MAALTGATERALSAGRTPSRGNRAARPRPGRGKQGDRGFAADHQQHRQRPAADLARDGGKLGRLTGPSSDYWLRSSFAPADIRTRPSIAAARNKPACWSITRSSAA